MNSFSEAGRFFMPAFPVFLVLFRLFPQYVASVYSSYLNWLTTQEEDYALPDNIPRSELL